MVLPSLPVNALLEVDGALGIVHPGVSFGALVIERTDDHPVVDET